jgi:peptidylprolyl isomerase
MRRLLYLFLTGAAAFAFAAIGTGDEKKADHDWKSTATGLKYEDVTAGTGAQPKTGQTVVVHYTGWLWENDAKGKKFDSSVDRNQPFKFQLGGRVIKGWNEGVATMKVGGKRLLLIPPQLAYGPQGYGGVIPPNATLLFEVELMGIE